MLVLSTVLGDAFVSAIWLTASASLMNSLVKSTVALIASLNVITTCLLLGLRFNVVLTIMGFVVSAVTVITWSAIAAIVLPDRSLNAPAPISNSLDASTAAKAL